MGWVQSRTVGLIGLGAVLAGLCSVAAYFGRSSWILELTTHFRIQYVAYLLLAAVVLAFCRRWRAAAACVLAGLLSLVPIASLLLPDGTAPDLRTSDGQHMRALLLNVNSANTSYDAVVSLIQEFDPDFVVLEEINSAWDAATSALHSAYPHRRSVPREDNFGIKLMSKRPMLSSDIVYLDGAEVPTVIATFDISGQTLMVMGTHPVPPVGAQYAAFRNEHLAAVAARMTSTTGPRLLLGDLNVTPWSPYFGDLLEDSGLRNASQGRGFSTTWPTFFWPLRIQLDHCLHSADIQIVDKRIGQHVGSDHLPVQIEFRVVAPPPG